MSKALVLLVVASLSFNPSTPARAAQVSGDFRAPSKAQWREDLKYLAAELPKRHKNAFHTTTREKFERAVAELDAAIPALQDHQIVVRLLQLTAGVGDGHTIVQLPAHFQLFPVQFYWFGDELRVTHAAAEYKEALGARVRKIGGVGVEEVRARLTREVLSQAEIANKWYVMSASASYINRPEVLHTLGILPNAGRAPFTFEDDGGRQFTVEIAPVVPDRDPASGALRMSLGGAAEGNPISRQKPAEGFWYTHLPESQTVYLNFRRYPKCGLFGSCQEFEDLLKFVDEKRAARLVIDLRQNTGGDSTKVRRGLIPAIKKRPQINRRGGLYVITGRRTFSAALWNAIDFRKDTNAIIVGEPPGEMPNSYSENDEMTLPNSRLVVSYSTRYYKLLDEDVPAFMPDKLIEPNWADYKAGRDTALDWILAQGADARRGAHRARRAARPASLQLGQHEPHRNRLLIF